MASLREYLLVEQQIINQFKNSKLNKPPFNIESNVKWRKGIKSFEFDIVIKYNSIPLAIVEIKSSFQQPGLMNAAKLQIKNAFNILNCYYGIIADDREFHLCKKNSNEYQKLDFENIIEILINHKNPIFEDKQHIISKINEILEQYGYDSFVGKIVENDGKCYFKNNEETSFWRELLNSDKDVPKLLYRYTTLDTVLFILKNGIYRMNGIVGMNDSSEIDYFDVYCYNGNNKPSYKILNNFFLLSCSSLKDNLTMWRLYGDNAKGVCLVFEVEPIMPKEFILQNVSYAKNGKDKNLALIKQLIKHHLVFNDIDKWKHFFKAEDYSIEQEVRLLFFDNANPYVKNREWIKTTDHSIINPYVEFDINNTKFPLILKEIILGPKCPEKLTNEYQLNELIQQKEYLIEVKSSSISNYR